MVRINRYWSYRSRFVVSQLINCKFCRFLYLGNEMNPLNRHLGYETPTLQTERKGVRLRRHLSLLSAALLPVISRNRADNMELTFDRGTREVEV